MKIANKGLLLGAGLMAFGISVGAQSVLAQGSASPAPVAAANPAPPLAESVKSSAAPTAYLNGPPANPSTQTAIAPKTVVAEAAPAVTSPAGDNDAADDSSASLPGAKKDAKDADEDKPTTKVPDSVKNVLKTLKVKSEDLTLDDLNAAREAVAKLDALIDIEKRLVELDKVRHERDKENNIFSAIPASALGSQAYARQAIMPPPQPIAAAAPPPMPMYMPASTVDVERIEGSNSNYSAFIKEGDAVRQVKIGDKLSDGSLVQSITPRGVELKRGDNSSHLVQVKDVQTVFGDSH